MTQPLVTAEQRAQLLAVGACRADGRSIDPMPVVRLLERIIKQESVACIERPDGGRRCNMTVANIVPADERPAYARLLAVAPARRSSAPPSRYGNRHSNLDLKIRDTLAFEFHGSPESVAEQAALTGEIVREFGGEDFEWASAPEERNRLWKARHNAWYAVVSQRPGAKGWSSDVCVPVSELAESVLHAREALAGSKVPAAILGHVGDGNFHVVFAVDPDRPEEMAEVAAINKKMVERAISVGGTCTGEHGVGIGKIAYLRAEHGEALEAMKLVKAAFDPLRILNLGKIL